MIIEQIMWPTQNKKASTTQPGGITLETGGEIVHRSFYCGSATIKEEVVAGAGIEPATQGFSVLCSTD
jgi:hypothetical protein